MGEKLPCFFVLSELTVTLNKMENNKFWTTTMFARGAMTVLVLLALFLLGKSLNEFKEYNGNPQELSTITVSGTGEVFAVPDIATFNFSITEEGKTVSEAQKKATDKNNNVMKVLRDQGIDDKDIVSVPNLNPKYEYLQVRCTYGVCPPSNSTVVGYQASNYITVKVRKADDAGTVTAKLAEAGVQNLSSVSYTIDNDDKLQLEARTKAIEDAKERAEKLADDLNVDLEEITSFSEGGRGGYDMMYAKAAPAMAESMGGMATPDLPRGENRIVSTVSITFRID